MDFDSGPTIFATRPEVSVGDFSDCRINLPIEEPSYYHHYSQPATTATATATGAGTGINSLYNHQHYNPPQMYPSASHHHHHYPPPPVHHHPTPAPNSHHGLHHHHHMHGHHHPHHVQHAPHHHGHHAPTYPTSLPSDPTGASSSSVSAHPHHHLPHHPPAHHTPPPPPTLAATAASRPYSSIVNPSAAAVAQAVAYGNSLSSTPAPAPPAPATHVPPPQPNPTAAVANQHGQQHHAHSHPQQYSHAQQHPPVASNKLKKSANSKSSANSSNIGKILNPNSNSRSSNKQASSSNSGKRSVNSKNMSEYLEQRNILAEACEEEEEDRGTPNLFRTFDKAWSFSMSTDGEEDEEEEDEEEEEEEVEDQRPQQQVRLQPAPVVQQYQDDGRQAQQSRRRNQHNPNPQDNDEDEDIVRTAVHFSHHHHYELEPLPLKKQQQISRATSPPGTEAGAHTGEMLENKNVCNGVPRRTVSGSPSNVGRIDNNARTVSLTDDLAITNHRSRPPSTANKNVQQPSFGPVDEEGDTDEEKLLEVWKDGAGWDSPHPPPPSAQSIHESILGGKGSLANGRRFNGTIPGILKRKRTDADSKNFDVASKEPSVCLHPRKQAMDQILDYMKVPAAKKVAPSNQPRDREYGEDVNEACGEEEEEEDESRNRHHSSSSKQGSVQQQSSAKKAKSSDSHGSRSSKSKSSNPYPPVAGLESDLMKALVLIIDFVQVTYKDQNLNRKINAIVKQCIIKHQRNDPKYKHLPGSILQQLTQVLGRDLVREVLKSAAKQKTPPSTSSDIAKMHGLPQSQFGLLVAAAAAEGKELAKDVSSNNSVTSTGSNSGRAQAPAVRSTSSSPIRSCLKSTNDRVRRDRRDLAQAAMAYGFQLAREQLLAAQLKSEESKEMSDCHFPPSCSFDFRKMMRDGTEDILNMSEEDRSRFLADSLTAIDSAVASVSAHNGSAPLPLTNGSVPLSCDMYRPDESQAQNGVKGEEAEPLEEQNGETSSQQNDSR